MLAEIELRALSQREVVDHRQLCASFPDPYLAVLLRAFPKFSDIVRFVDPDQRALLQKIAQLPTGDLTRALLS